MKTIIWHSLSPSQHTTLLARPALADAAALREQTLQIIEQTRAQGDAALIALTQKYDGVTLTPETLRVEASTLAAAAEKITTAAKQAIDHAFDNITTFHQAQVPMPVRVEIQAGIWCSKAPRPIARVGLYIPGGTAILLSTVLMLGVPAQLAGCEQRVLCTPPNQSGDVDPHILYAAQRCGITQIFKAGGAQAVAAMAYGTDTVPKVDKIFGPGNAWVTQAKLLVAQDPQGAAFDLPAGPSEVMVIADSSANPAFVAADLLSQAEHGVDSQAICVCTSTAQAENIAAAVDAQLATLPRQAIAAQALQHSSIIVVEDVSQAISIANDYAAEHLILQLDNAEQWMEAITAAGSVFLGHFAPESVGDYASGTNHVLPTYGYAKNYSGLSVSDFMTQITFQSLTAKGLQQLSHTVETLAEIEGLAAHQRAVSLRCDCIAAQDADLPATEKTI